MRVRRKAAPELLRLNAHLDDDQIRRAPLELVWANAVLQQAGLSKKF